MFEPRDFTTAFIVYFYLTSQVLEFHFNQIGVRQEVYITAAKAKSVNITLVLLFLYKNSCQRSAGTNGFHHQFYI